MNNPNDRLSDQYREKILQAGTAADRPAWEPTFLECVEMMQRVGLSYERGLYEFNDAWCAIEQKLEEEGLEEEIDVTLAEVEDDC